MVNRSVEVIRLFNSHEFGAIMPYLGLTFTWRDPVHGQIRHADFLAYLSGWKAGMCDVLLANPEFHPAAGGAVFITFEARGTHTGTILGAEPTNRWIAFDGVILHKWRTDGLLDSGRIYFDTAELARGIR